MSNELTTSNNVNKSQVLDMLKHGNPEAVANFIVQMNSTLVQQERTVKHLQNQMDTLRSQLRISRTQADQLAFAANTTVMQACGGESAPAYQSRMKQTVYFYLWQEFHKELGVASYREVANQDFEKALEFIKEWAPSMDLIVAIYKYNEA